MTFEQRAKFDEELQQQTGSGDSSVDEADRRAYALRFGELT